MTRQEIKSLLSRNADDPRKVIAAMMGDANLENGFKVLLQSSYPAMLLKDRIAIIQDIVDNAPDELLHSIFYYNRSELKEHLYPKYFIIQILDYLNNQNSY